MRIWVLRLCWVGVAWLLLFAVSFFLFPDFAEQLSAHQPERLMLVMGDRYLVMAFYLAAALMYPDKRVLSVVLLGYAAMGLIDGLIYANDMPWPHAGAGLLCVFGAWVVWPRTTTNGARD